MLWKCASKKKSRMRGRISDPRTLNHEAPLSGEPKTPANCVPSMIVSELPSKAIDETSAPVVFEKSLNSLFRVIAVVIAESRVHEEPPLMLRITRPPAPPRSYAYSRFGLTGSTAKVVGLTRPLFALTGTAADVNGPVMRHTSRAPEAPVLRMK